MLGAAVRVGTIRVGEVVGVFVDREERRAIGIEVSTAGGARRFVPWVAAQHADGAICVHSSLVIVDDSASYERRGARVLRDVVSLGRLRVAAGDTLEPVDAVSTAAVMGTNGR